MVSQPQHSSRPRARGDACPAALPTSPRRFRSLIVSFLRARRSYCVLLSMAGSVVRPLACSVVSAQAHISLSQACLALSQPCDGTRVLLRERLDSDGHRPQDPRPRRHPWLSLRALGGSPARLFATPLTMTTGSGLLTPSPRARKPRTTTSRSASATTSRSRFLHWRFSARKRSHCCASTPCRRTAWRRGFRRPRCLGSSPGRSGLVQTAPSLTSSLSARMSFVRPLQFRYHGSSSTLADSPADTRSARVGLADARKLTTGPRSSVLERRRKHMACLPHPRGGLRPA